ncbi:MAG TPA: O-antigen ligase family protein [Flavobacteriales bacterium]|nr:O-antigen ligase family protein [Flavobacteriales bacterium]
MYQKYQDKASQIEYWVMLLLVFLVPVEKKALPPLIILLFINWLAQGNFNERFRWQKGKSALVFCVLFFATYLVGLCCTNNFHDAFKSIEVKLSFLFLSVVFFFHPVYSHKHYGKILLVFIAGCVVSSFLHLGIATYNFYDEIAQVKAGKLYDTYTNWNFYFASLLSNRHHPGYLSMYYLLALCAGIHLLNNRKTYGLDTKKIFLIIFAFICLPVMLFLLSSKTGIAATFILFMGVFIYYIIKNRHSKLIIGAGLLLLFAGVFTVIKSDIIRSRFTYLMEAFSSRHVVDKTSTESNEVRMLVWNASLDLIAKNPVWGYGTGNVTDILRDEYKKRGYTGALSHNLNAHSQFFQSQLELGILGSLLLSLIVLSGLLTALRRKNFLILALFFIVLINLPVESLFEAQGGTVFFTLFTGFLLNGPRKEEQHSLR